MTSIELLARIAALVPPPRYPLVRYHGVFASAHTWRQSVVPKPPTPARPAARACQPSPTSAPEPPEPGPSVDPDPAFALAPSDDWTDLPPLASPFVLSDKHLRRLLDGLLLMTGPRADWATLLRRTYGIDVLACPRCHGRLRLLAVVRDRDQARRVLAWIAKRPEPRPLAPARDPTAHVGT
jgi:hypothetical protein